MEQIRNFEHALGTCYPLTMRETNVDEVCTIALLVCFVEIPIHFALSPVGGLSDCA